MILLGVDPGKITGYAVWSGGRFEFADQCPMMEFLAWADVTIPTYAPWELQVVCEKFSIGQQTLTRAADAHWAIGQNEILRYWCLKHDVPFEQQTPSQAKAFATDEKLKNLGWWSPSPGGHKNDAVRHLVFRLVKLGMLDPADLVTPRAQ